MNDIVPPSVSRTSSGLIDRVKSILMKPVPTWDVIAAEPATVQSVVTGYVAPLAAIPALALFIGTALTTVWALGIGFLIALLVSCVVGYIGGIISVLLLAFLINFLAPRFNGEANFVQAFKLAAYGCTATWVAGILFVILPLGGLAVFCGLLYSLYLIYLGLPKLMKSPADKSAVYLIVVIVITLVVGIVVRLLLVMVLGFGLFGGSMMHPGLGMAPRSAPATVTIPGMGTVDVNKAQAAADKIEAAATAMKAGQPVKTIDPQVLVDLMPGNFNGAARSDLTSGSDSVANGIATSHASATYAVGGGTIHLTVADTGAGGLISGMGALAQATNLNHTENTANGYDKISTDNGRTITEKYDNPSKSGSYSVIYGGRIGVSAEGNGVDMNTIKSLVQAVDPGRVEALAK